MSGANIPGHEKLLSTICPVVEWNVRETADGTEVSFFAKNSPPGSHFHVFKTYVFPDILRGHAYNLEKLTNPAAVLPMRFAGSPVPERRT